MYARLFLLDSTAASLPPWQDLPLDLLCDISDRLLVTADYVHFHTTCKPCRDTLPPAHRRPAVLPWLVTPRDALGHRKARCVFYSKSRPFCTAASEVCVPDPRWVINPDDGTVTSWLVTKSACGTIDPLTGSAAAMPVPRFPDEIKRWEDSAIGVASSDGTVIFYAYDRIHVVDLFAHDFAMMTLSGHWCKGTVFTLVSRTGAAAASRTAAARS
ncbi:hypothetical protein PR202_ga24490 [Eleusine coracana subsp. coracana]|uniref:Uncharacterized protein n=1 Tax=Eleusine coracana subsp. coracana TaxID=191504 RepID=A0AAV5D6X7_ELECO|nr:hypothetical protein PR202_ga24490 [Eleusine coracana subsp. coracana]